jgi:hypothetical protein
MKILISTKETQGKRKSDFSFTDENEILMLGMECDTDKVIDGGCGCRRALCGIDTAKATTTFQVSELPITREDLITLTTNALVKQGWGAAGDESLTNVAIDSVDSLLDIANHFPVNSIIEKRGDSFKLRR